MEKLLVGVGVGNDEVGCVLGVVVVFDLVKVLGILGDEGYGFGFKGRDFLGSVREGWGVLV